MGYCTECGSERPNDAKFCPNCGKPAEVSVVGQSQTIRQTPPVVPSPPESPLVENHLVKAILVTLFGCMPIGIVALIYSSQVEPAVAKRDYRKAFEMSEQAKKWANWGIYAGIAVSAISLIALILFLTAFMGDAEKYISLIFPQPHKW